MFSQACVKNSVHRGAGMYIPACNGHGGVHTPPKMATAAGGTHLTGMHSCFVIKDTGMRLGVLGIRREFSAFNENG